MKLYEGGKLYNTKADRWEAITAMSKIKSIKRKDLQNQRPVDYWLLLRRVNILKCEEFKYLSYELNLFSSTKRVDQFLAILLK